MTDFNKANMDGSLEREFDTNTPYRQKGKRKRDYTIEVVDEQLNILWHGTIQGANGPKHARDLWRIQFPEVRQNFISKRCMVRVR